MRIRPFLSIRYQLIILIFRWASFMLNTFQVHILFGLSILDSKHTQLSREKNYFLPSRVISSFILRHSVQHNLLYNSFVIMVWCFNWYYWVGRREGIGRIGPCISSQPATLLVIRMKLPWTLGYYFLLFSWYFYLFNMGMNMGSRFLGCSGINSLGSWVTLLYFILFSSGLSFLSILGVRRVDEHGNIRV